MQYRVTHKGGWSLFIMMVLIISGWYRIWRTRSFIIVQVKMPLLAGLWYWQWRSPCPVSGSPGGWILHAWRAQCVWLQSWSGRGTEVRQGRCFKPGWFSSDFWCPLVAGLMRPCGAPLDYYTHTQPGAYGAWLSALKWHNFTWWWFNQGCCWMLWRMEVAQIWR